MENNEESEKKAREMNTPETDRSPLVIGTISSACLAGISILLCFVPISILFTMGGGNTLPLVLRFIIIIIPLFYVLSSANLAMIDIDEKDKVRSMYFIHCTFLAVIYGFSLALPGKIRGPAGVRIVGTPIDTYIFLKNLSYVESIYCGFITGMYEKGTTISKLRNILFMLIMTVLTFIVFSLIVNRVS